MKKGWVWLLTVLLVASFGLGSALAQDKKPLVTQTTFTKFDANKDGVVTVAEYDAYWRGRFNEIDANKDGKIMADEFEASQKKVFGEIDANKDNALVAQEFVAYYCGANAKVPKKKGKAPKNIDANKNGKVDPNECAVFWIAKFHAADANKDGKVTMEEFLTAAKKEFKDMDMNQDGAIVIQEFAFYYSGKKAKAAAAN
jgi:Ca2+-binding EF-hand superfamily protein